MALYIGQRKRTKYTRFCFGFERNSRRPNPKKINLLHAMIEKIIIHNFASLRPLSPTPQIQFQGTVAVTIMQWATTRKSAKTVKKS